MSVHLGIIQKASVACQFADPQKNRRSEKGKEYVIKLGSNNSLTIHGGPFRAQLIGRNDGICCQNAHPHDTIAVRERRFLLKKGGLP